MNKKPHAQVTIPNEIPTQPRRSLFSLDNPEIHSRYCKSTSQSILANRSGTRRSLNGLVIDRATTHKWGVTVPESKPTPTASNHRTGSTGRKHLGAHLPAENRSWSSQQALVERSQPMHLEMKRQVNPETDNVDTHSSVSKQTWRRSRRHTRRKAGEQLVMISAPSTARMSSVPTSAPTRSMISATA